MLRSIVFKWAILAAAGVAVLFFSPAVAQLAAGAGTAQVSGVHLTAEMTPPAFITYFTGLTYPDTSAGLTACDEEGGELVYISDGEDLGYNCQLGNPDAGVYNLWITYINPNCHSCGDSTANVALAVRSAADR
jgi:hypothetical protein